MSWLIVVARALPLLLLSVTCTLAHQCGLRLYDDDDVLSHTYWAPIILCQQEDYERYQTILCPLEEAIQNQTTVADRIVFRYINLAPCSDPGWLRQSLTAYDMKNATRTLVGVIAPAAQAEAHEAEKIAEKYRVPVIAYDLTASVRSTGGRAATLAVSLRRMLAACSWRRLAVLHSLALADIKLKNLLAAEPALKLRSEPLATPTLNWTLTDLRDADARVFLVCADAELTARTLERAARLGLTRAEGYIWIVREYDPRLVGVKVGNATMPLLVSFQWRGVNGSAERWTDPEWLPHATAIADAMLVLAEGKRRLFREYPDVRNATTRMETYLTLFLNGIRVHTNVTMEDVTVERDFTFDKEQGIVKTDVFVKQWDGKSPPQRMDGASEDRCPLDPVPRDNTRACLMAADDSFDPACLEYLVAAAVTVAAVALAACVFGAVFVRRRLRTVRRRAADRDFCKRMLLRYPGAFAVLERRIIDRSAVKFNCEIGAGGFGSVALAELSGSRNGPLVVAVKRLRPGADLAEEAEFVREASTLAGLRHEHIVGFVGVCVADGPPLLLMEHAFFGDLQRYLLERRHFIEGATDTVTPGDSAAEAAHVSAEALTRLAREAAAALAHLAEHSIAHRDVRAANCLVDARHSLKLADFGMARLTNEEDGEYTCRRRALFPVLWMAPETLMRGVSSPASDVWSLGVLALELVTLGARPWGACSVSAAAAALRGGARPPLPADASAGTRALAAACWRRAVSSRPSAARVAAWLARRPRVLRPALAPLEPAPTDAAEDSGFGEPTAVDLDLDVGGGTVRCVVK